MSAVIHKGATFRAERIEAMVRLFEKLQASPTTADMLRNPHLLAVWNQFRQMRDRVLADQANLT